MIKTWKPTEDVLGCVEFLEECVLVYLEGFIVAGRFRDGATEHPYDGSKRHAFRIWKEILFEEVFVDDYRIAVIRGYDCDWLGSCKRTDGIIRDGP